MALNKQEKNQIVDEVAELLGSSKITVVARYPGTSVKAMQQLRKAGQESGTTVRVIKNRLFKLAMAKNPNLAELDREFLRGQLLYAFNARDEAAPARNLAEFSKNQPEINFVGAITAEGAYLSPDEVEELSRLPSLQQLRGQLVGLIISPASGVVNVLSANMRSLLNVLEARGSGLNPAESK